LERVYQDARGKTYRGWTFASDKLKAGEWIFAVSLVSHSYPSRSMTDRAGVRLRLPEERGADRARAVSVQIEMRLSIKHLLIRATLPTM
jgi:hypothetical protein